MALAGGKAGAAECDALIERHVVADLSGLADHDTGAMIDEQTLADTRGRMYLDPGYRSRHERDRAGKHRHLRCVQRMRDAVGEQ